VQPIQLNVANQRRFVEECAIDARKNDIDDVRPTGIILPNRNRRKQENSRNLNSDRQLGPSNKNSAFAATLPFCPSAGEYFTFAVARRKVAIDFSNHASVATNGAQQVANLVRPAGAVESNQRLPL
jgi:hypothetical protein